MNCPFNIPGCERISHRRCELSHARTCNGCTFCDHKAAESDKIKLELTHREAALVYEALDFWSISSREQGVHDACIGVMNRIHEATEAGH